MKSIVPSWLEYNGYEVLGTSDGNPVDGCWIQPETNVIIFLQEDCNYSIAKGNFEENEILAENISQKDVIECLDLKVHVPVLVLKHGYKNTWIAVLL